MPLSDIRQTQLNLNLRSTLTSVHIASSRVDLLYGILPFWYRRPLGPSSCTRCSWTTEHYVSVERVHFVVDHQSVVQRRRHRSSCCNLV